jgi:hypothetical protein
MLDSFSSEKTIPGTFPLISEVIEDILFIDKPLVTLGQNSLGTKIFSIFITEENNVSRYLNTLVSDEDVDLYLIGEKTLLSIQRESEQHYLVDFQEEEIEIKSVDTTELPDDYFPSENSFYPYFDQRSLNNKISITVNGGLAEQCHAIQTKDSALLESGFEEIIKTIRNWILPMDDTRLLTLGRREGSHKIEFLLSATNEIGQTNLSIDEQKLSKLYKKIIQYTWNKLLIEAPDLNFGEISLEGLSEIKQAIRDYMNTSGIEIENLDESIINMILDISKSNSQIASVLNSGYTNFSIDEVNEENRYLPLTIVDSERSLRMMTTYKLLEERLGRTIDNEVRTYNVHVYDLNTETGKGWVEIKTTSEEGDVKEKARLQILNVNTVENSIYTQSLSDGSFVDIQATTEESRGRITKLMV